MMLCQKRTDGIALSFLMYATSLKLQILNNLWNFVLKINQFCQSNLQITKINGKKQKFLTFFE